MKMLIEKGTPKEVNLFVNGVATPFQPQNNDFEGDSINLKKGIERLILKHFNCDLVVTKDATIVRKK